MDRDTVYWANKRLDDIGDAQYWAERALIDAEYPVTASIGHVDYRKRCAALDEVYKDLCARREPH